MAVPTMMTFEFRGLFDLPEKVLGETRSPVAVPQFWAHYAYHEMLAVKTKFLAVGAEVEVLADEALEPRADDGGLAGIANNSWVNWFVTFGTAWCRC